MVFKTISLGLFILSFIITFLADGGVYAAPQAVAVVLLSISLAFACVGVGLNPRTVPLFQFVFVTWIALLAWIAIQYAPLGSYGNTAWQSLREIDSFTSASISVVPGDAAASMLAISLPFLTALTALAIFRSDADIEFALRTFGIIGSSISVVAIVQFTAFPKSLLFSDKQFYFDSLTVPFVNRNTAATFYGLISIAILANSFLTKKVSNGGIASRVIKSETRIHVRWQLLTLILPVLVALALTRSRGGISASIVGCSIVCIGAVLELSKARRKIKLFKNERLHARSIYPALARIASFFFVVLAIATAGYFLFGQVVFRAQLQGGSDARFCVWPSIIQLANDNSLRGIGPSSFPYYFPAYRDPHCGLVGTWDKAHNVFLEAAIAFGAPATAAFAIAYFIALSLVYRRGILRRKSRRILVLAGIAASAMVVLHSLVDFSLQIPAFAMSFAFFLALTATISLNVSASNAFSKR